MCRVGNHWYGSHVPAAYAHWSGICSGFVSLIFVKIWFYLVVTYLCITRGLIKSIRYLRVALRNVDNTSFTVQIWMLTISIGTYNSFQYWLCCVKKSQTEIPKRCSEWFCYFVAFYTIYREVAVEKKFIRTIILIGKIQLGLVGLYLV